MSDLAIKHLELVARLGSNEVAHDDVRDQLRELLPQTSLAAAAAALRQLEARTRKVGLEALRQAAFIPPVELVEPQPPRHPVRDEDLELAAQLLSPAVIPDDEIRTELGRQLARGPLGPAVWKVRDIEWAVATPPAFAGRPPVGIAALDCWRAAGELVDELLARTDRHQAAAQKARFHHSLVAHNLLARERPLRFQEPRRGLDLARLAASVAEGIMRRPGPDWRRFGGLVALALASLANAQRIVGEAMEARRVLRTAEPYIRGESDPVLLWEYFGLVATTLTNLRQPDEARQALNRAIALARSMGDSHRVAKALAQGAHLDHVTGKLTHETLSSLTGAVKAVDDARDPGLSAMILLNLAVGQAELGLHDEAMITWEAVDEFSSPIEELKRRGVLGFLHLAAERWEPACVELQKVGAGLIERGFAEGLYYQILTALALLGADRAEDASRVSLAATKHLSSAQYSAIAVEAKNVADQARQRMINRAALDRLRRAIEADVYPFRNLELTPKG